MYSARLAEIGRQTRIGVVEPHLVGWFPETFVTILHNEVMMTIQQLWHIKSPWHLLGNLVKWIVVFLYSQMLISMECIYIVKIMSLDKEGTGVLGKMKALFETWERLDKNKVLMCYEILRYMWVHIYIYKYIYIWWKIRFETRFKMDKHTSGKWLTYGIEHGHYKRL